jgi:hypothetical protein
MVSLLLFIIWFVVATAPTQPTQGASRDFYHAIEEHIQATRAESGPGALNLSSVQMPHAPTPLPSPDEGSSLKLVAIGRGVQVVARKPTL